MQTPRTLSPPPSFVADPVSGALLTGSFRGPLPRVDLSPLHQGLLSRFLHRKRWVYALVASEELVIGLVVVELGYAANAFVFVYDRKRRRMPVEHTALGPPFFAAVSDSAEEGCLARFALGKTSLRVERPAGAAVYNILVAVPGLELSARLDTGGAPPPISAIVNLGDLGGGRMNATQKRALLPVTGAATVAGTRYSLDGALGGIDYTQGYLHRHTAWRWAFLLGQSRGGERVGLNLVEGFVGAPECALWLDGDLFPLPEGRFDFSRENPIGPWRVRTADDQVDLRFEPGAVHAEHKDLYLVASRFVQVAGHYSGTIALPGRPPLHLDGVPGVTEDQDVRW